MQRLKPTCLIALVWLISSFNRIQANTFTVSNLNDSGPGSLRQAILDANANPGSDVIIFTVSEQIAVQSQLPDLNDPSGGTTIEWGPVLVGPGAASGVSGLRIVSSDNIVRGLGLRLFAKGIDIPSQGI